MDHKKVAAEVLIKVGGKENIKEVTHCVTRLRFSLKDEKKVNDDEIKKIDGVMDSVNKGGQYQVIIGNEVGKVYSELIKETGNLNNNENSDKKQKETITQKILGVILGSFMPLIPVIAGAGMLKILLSIISMFNLLPESSGAYKLLLVMADSIYYFLPFFIAYTSALKFKATPFLAMIIPSVLLYPNFIMLTTHGSQQISFFGIPVSAVSYSSSLIPIMLGVWFMSYVEKLSDKIIPNSLKMYFKPLVIILITIPVVFIVIGPIGAYIEEYFIKLIQIIDNNAGWLGVGILAATYPLLVLTGMHNAVPGFIVLIIVGLHFDPMLIPSALAANTAQAGAAFAVGLRTKNKKIRKEGFSATVSALLGITEPAMFGINLKFKRPIYAVIIGAGIGGCLAGLLKVTAYAFVNPAVVTLPIFIGKDKLSLFYAALVAVVSFIVPFILTLILGIKDEKEVVVEEVESKITEKYICSPIEGMIKELSEVNDEVFSKELAGKGVAFISNNNEVKSPIDGKVTMVFPSKHAIGLTSNDGVELLIHIGIDTVKLNGSHFEVFVKVGDDVKIGDLMVKFDKDAIEKEGYETTTMLTVSNTSIYEDVIKVKTGNVKFMEHILKII